MAARTGRWNRSIDTVRRCRGSESCGYPDIGDLELIIAGASGGRLRLPAGVQRRWGRMAVVTTPRDLVLLGSTGSIGTQAIDIVRRNPDRFRVVGAGRRRRQRRAARRAGAGAGRRGGRGGQGVRRAGPAARLLRRGAAGAGYATGGFRIPKILAGPDAMTELAAVAVRRGAQRGGRLARACAPTLAALRGRPYPRAGQQGVAGRRRPAGQGRGGRGRGRSSRSTPSTRRWPSACAAGTRGRGAAAGPDRQRRPVPGAAARRAGRRHARAGAGPPDLEHGAGRHDQLGHPGQQGRWR